MNGIKEIKNEITQKKKKNHPFTISLNIMSSFFNIVSIIIHLKNLKILN